MNRKILKILIFLLCLFSVRGVALAENVEERYVLSVRGEVGSFYGEYYLNERFATLGAGKLGETFLKITENGFSVEEAVGYVFSESGENFTAFLRSEEWVEKDAGLTFTPNGRTKFSYVPETVGRRINREKLARDIAELLDGKRTEIELEINKIQPRVTKEQLIKETALIANFSTNYSRSLEGRKRNVALATRAVNGAVIAPGETFSFNARVGERTAERGYTEANVIVGGKYVKGVGGGVCQVSTTLYNAVIRAGVEITEVRSHSLAPTYVPLSFDSMVSSYSDLKFRNVSDVTLYVTGSADGENITFSVYGLKGDVTRSYESVTREVIAPEKGETVDDPELSEGTVVIERGIDGYRSEGYEIRRYADGREERVMIRRDRYSAKREVVRRGTKPVDEGKDGQGGEIPSEESPE